MIQPKSRIGLPRLALAASLPALALGCAAPALAQAAPQAAAPQADAPPADANAGTGNADIVVTAQFRNQRLQDTPLSITAVNADMLAARNQTDLSQIAANAPNVQLTPMGGAFGSSQAAYIRGIGQYDFNPAYEPGVGIYVDDVYYATLTGNILDLLDLDRVEVLRGPQGTLTGRNSIGGAIKLFSAQPNATNSGSVDLAYGSRQRIDVRASANFRLTDSLFMRVAGVYKHQNGYVDEIDYGCANPNNALGITGNPSTPKNCVVDKLGEKGYAGLRGSLRYNPNNTIDWTVTGDYTYEKHTASAGVITQDVVAKTDGIDFTCGRFCTYASWFLPAGGQVTQAYTLPNTVKLSGYGFSSNLNLNLADNVSLKAITAWRYYHEIFGTDDDYTPDPNIGGGGFNDLTFRFFSQELRLNAKAGNFADFTLGGYYNNQKSVYFTRQDIRYIGHGLPFLDLQFTGNDPIRANSKAVFGTVILHPAPNLNITGGIRYTREHKDYTFVRKNLAGGTLTDIFGVGALDGTVANYNGSKVDYRISVDYRFSPEVLAYATVSTGFKGGGVTARPFTKNQAVNGTFNPETLTTFEGGIKTDLFDRMVRFNFSAFYQKYKNIQLPLADCAVLDGFAAGKDPFPCAAIGNAGDANEYGFEAELNVHSGGFTADGSFSYLGGKWTRIGAAVGSSILITDPVVSPHVRMGGGMQYEADFGDSGSLTPRFDVAYIGRQNLGRLPGNTTLDFNPAQALVNARLTWKNKDKDLAISLEVQNLFDKYYLQPLRFAALYAFAGTTYSTVGRPREWAISVHKSF